MYMQDSPRTRPWGTGMYQDTIDWTKLNKWARENLVCAVCGRRVGKEERIKMHIMPDFERREAEIRIAHYTCLGYEDDGVTPWEPKTMVHIPGKDE